MHAPCRKLKLRMAIIPSVNDCLPEKQHNILPGPMRKFHPACFGKTRKPHHFHKAFAPRSQVSYLACMKNWLHSLKLELVLHVMLLRVSGNLSLISMFQNCTTLRCSLWLFRSQGKSFSPVPTETCSRMRPGRPRAGF